VPELADGAELFTRPPLVLYFTAEPFEYPRAAWPAGFRLVGPCAWEPPSQAPAWLTADERPVVLVSTSSEYQGDEQLVSSAFAALADRSDLLVVATMPSADPGSIAVPANARIERFQPHGPLLERAVAVVCHGGMGVTQKALAAGVPVCAVPFGRDQLEVARRLEVSGAGTRLPVGRLTPARLRSAVEGAIARRAGAQRIAAAFAAAGGGESGADAVEALAAARSQPTLLT
jgi:MGT family glycosyltransferase